MKASSIRKALSHLIAVQRPVFIWGPPGVGKSDVVAQTASDSKLEVRDVRLSLLDPTDLKGFPVPDLEKKLMCWLPADFLPTKGKGILFLDEMNQAPQAVQGAAYQLILNRKVGDYKLPDGWAVVAAGNRTSDRSIAHAMPAALANRFIHLDFDVNAEEWDDWASKNKIHTDIRAFIKFRPGLLHSFDSVSNPRAFPSPRSWAFVNDTYKSALSQDEEFELTKGTIGEGASAEFNGFVRQIKDLPTISQIISEPEKTPIPASPGALYALIMALATKTAVANIVSVMKYVIRMPIEFQVMYIKYITNNPALIGTKSYIDWVISNRKVFIK